MDIRIRSTDSEKLEFNRSNRFQLIDGQWYYQTREKIQLGPYDSINHAQAGLQSYLRYLYVEVIDQAS